MKLGSPRPPQTVDDIVVIHKDRLGRGLTAAPSFAYENGIVTAGT